MNSIEAVTNIVFDIYQVFIAKEHLMAIFSGIQSAYDNIHLSTLQDIPQKTGTPSHFNSYVTSLFLNYTILIQSVYGTLH